MLKLDELVPLSEEQDGKRTLSAYIPVEGDTGNPGVAWRTLLRQGIARAREQIDGAPHNEKTEFDQCAERLMRRAEQDMHAQGGGTWIGIASTDDFLHDETVPELLPSLVTWSRSARIAPYLATLDPQRALVIVVDRVHAVFYRAEDGVMKEIDRLDTEPKGGAGMHMGAPPRQSFHVGTRGLPSADAISRQAIAAFKKHRAAIVERARTHDRGDWIVFGGAHEAVAQIAPQLEELAGDRLFVSGVITMTMSDAELRAAVQQGVHDLRERRQRELLADLLSGDRHPELNVLDRKTLDDALTLRNVDTVLLSRRWMTENPDSAEALVQKALGQRAAIEVANGSVGEMLDTACGGVAAKLRFAVVPT